MFCSTSFMVSCLTFKSYATLILFLCMVWRNVLSSLILHMATQLSQCHLLIRLPFSTIVFLLLLLKILSISPEKMKALMQKKKKNNPVHASVHSSTTYNCHDMGSSLSVHSWMNKEDLVCVCVYIAYIYIHTCIQQNAT